MARAHTESMPNPNADLPAKDKKKTGAKVHDVKAEVVGLVLLFSGLGFAAALVTFSPHDVKLIHEGHQAADTLQNAIGPVGARIGDLLLHLFGVGAFALNAMLLALAVRTLSGNTTAPRLRPTLGVLGGTLALLILLHVSSRNTGLRPFGHEAAGFVPGAIAVVMLALFSTVGTWLVALWVLAVSLTAVTSRSLVGELVRWTTGKARPVAATLGQSGASAAKQGLGSLKGVPGWFARRRAEKAVLAEANDDAPEPIDMPEMSWTSAELQADNSSEVLAPAVFSQAPETLVRPVLPMAPVADDPLLANLDIPTSMRRARPEPTAKDEVSVRLRLPDTAPKAVVHPAHALVATPAAAPVPEQTDVTPRTEREKLHAELAQSTLRPTGPMPVVGDLPQMPHLLVEELPVDDLKATLPEVDDVPPPIPPISLTNPGLRGTTPDRGDRALNVVQARVDVPHVDPHPHALTPAVLGAPAKSDGPRIVETEALRNERPAPVSASVQGDLGLSKVWHCPPHTLVQEPPARVVNMDAATLRENAIVLEQKLAEFNIHGEVTDIRPGPVVTTYEYRPAPGIKISKIVNLRDDLTMSLSALRVRIVAPIPGRDVVGIEVPNQNRQMVYFRELIDSAVYRDSTSPLTLILGKDIEGRPMCTDLARAPHLLVAGATGTGKSVGINTFLCSMLFRSTPDEVKLILIDPKILELSVYEGIPHLLLPVLDEPRKAELALKWAVAEMDRRYRLLAEAEVRNLAGYKQKLPELKAAALRKKQLAERVDLNGDVSEDLIDMPEDMPYIVVVIDEFADLIMAAGKEVEIPVARLAQKARAAGIHVILATQRPSVDVITGMIKANFPTRVSFQVASSMDSKVILGSVGAETLLGKGDMLFVPPGEGHLRRAHGTWITDEEVVAIARHWREQGTPKYEMNILKDPEDEAKSAVDMDDGEMDPLYDEAVQIVLDSQQASVSFLQRKLGIGYGRSARLVDTMENRGIVGPSRGPNKPREIMAHA